MRIPVDHQSRTPLYQQIEDYLRGQILSGALTAETRLPATRQLAQELGVSRITVNNAYAILESEGLVYTREGSGTYVLARPPLLPRTTAGTNLHWPRWQRALEQAVAIPYEQQHTPTRRITPHPAPIAFTGVGDPREFPVQELARAMQDVLRRDGSAALAYGALDQGYGPLRTTITHILASQGITAHPDHILITAGSQQALALLCQVLLQAGDVILVERPTYNLALELFRAVGLQVVGLPVDAEGMMVDQLEPLLQQTRPKLIYTIPNFQNPTGSCLSSARRRQLVALADRYNVPILEDDFVGDLRYDGRTQPALKTLDPGGRVIYTGTFSKMLMPGLRVGFLVAEGPIFQRLVELKRVSDLTTPPLMQRTLEAYVNVGQYQAHVRRSCRLYRQRRDAMLTAIRRHLPPEIHVDPPQGGLFVWLRLPSGCSCLDLIPLAREAGVEFAPGPRFFANPAEGLPYLRLNFATQTPSEISEGIRRLGSALQRLRGM
ncbi:MAG: PLP-dependent aminotransferase family protein [Caldilineaceae bacterium]|nr:PLP-dependent aminotransferase family protein [Caldilineaceae bacterium]